MCCDTQTRRFLMLFHLWHMWQVIIKFYHTPMDIPKIMQTFQHSSYNSSPFFRMKEYIRIQVSGGVFDTSGTTSGILSCKSWTYYNCLKQKENLWEVQCRQRLPNPSPFCMRIWPWVNSPALFSWKPLKITVSTVLLSNIAYSLIYPKLVN